MSRPPKALSLMISTRNRGASLDRMLHSVAAQSLPTSEWELLVADDGSHDHTREVLEAHRQRLPIAVVDAGGSGKSAALNRLLPMAAGKLFYFSDDDVEFACDHLTAVVSAADRVPDHGVFCGPITPMFPEGTPAWITAPNFAFAGGAFARYAPAESAGPTQALPYGPNFGVRAAVMQGMQFSEQIGPPPGSLVMGEETELLTALRARGVTMYFEPQAAVLHHVRLEQTAMQWLARRCWRVGYSNVMRTAAHTGRARCRVQAQWYAARAAALRRRMPPVGSPAELRGMARLELARLIGKVAAYRHLSARQQVPT